MIMQAIFTVIYNTNNDQNIKIAGSEDGLIKP